MKRLFDLTFVGKVYNIKVNILIKVIIIIIMYLYSAQYLHILQDSKRYLTNPTVQVQPQLTSNSHSPNWKIEAQG